MAESRDANDPRDLLRAMRKEERAEFEREEAGDTGGQEHASRDERQGVLPRGGPERTGEDVARSTAGQPDAEPGAGGGSVPSTVVRPGRRA